MKNVIKLKFSKLLTENSKSNPINKVDENADKSIVAGDDIESWKEVRFN